MGFFVAAKMPEITRKDAMAFGGLHKLKLSEATTADFQIGMQLVRLIRTSVLLQGKGSTGNARSTTSTDWYPSMLDPNSIIDSSESILCKGTSGSVSGLVLNPVGAWFYPPQ